MSISSAGLKVSRKNGEKFRKALVNLGLFDPKKKIRADQSHIYLPIQIQNIDDHLSEGVFEDILESFQKEALQILRSLGDFSVVDIEFEKKVLPISAEDLLGFRPHFEIVGDIAIVDCDEGVDEEKVASALMKVHKNVKTVIAPISPVEGEFRTRRFRHLAGERKTATLHKEHGLKYGLDLETVYFTPRLGTERKRLAKLIRPTETVLDMFAGVGPFALLLASKGAKVIAIDKNPEAVKYLRENAANNRIEEIEILEGDAFQLSKRYQNQADHIIMNLPHEAFHFLLPAINAVKDGGIVHYYSMSPEDDLYGEDRRHIEDAAQQAGAEVRILYQGIVRSYAPHQYNVVIDFQIIRGYAVDQKYLR